MLCIDCGSLVTFLDSTTNKLKSDVGSKRLAIDLEVMREAVEEGDLDFVRHVSGRWNYANENTKDLNPSEKILEQACATNVIHLPDYSD